MKRTLIAVAVLALAVPLSACSKSTTAGTNQSTTEAAKASTAESATTGAFNDADTTFTQGMIPHHEQAVEMADMALDLQTAAGPKVVALAKAIKAAQDPEITTIKGWLTAWGKDASGAMAGMNHPGGAMPGMMTAADMTSLGKAKAAEFDKSWETMMIAHHKGAIDMANTVIKDGKSADAKKLAAAVIKGQQAEIDQMTALLKG